MDPNPYSKELATAIRTVRRAAHISRTVLSQANRAGADSSDSTLIKGDLSPVTVADFAIQALLTATLGAAFPGDGFIGEESADDLRENPALLQRVLDVLNLCVPRRASNETEEWTAEDVCAKIDSCATITSLGPSSGRVWIFDPIDGTKTFIRGQQYAINAALVENGRQVLGVVGLPLLDMDASGPVSDADVDPTGRGSIMFAVRGHGSYVLPLLAGGASPGSNDDDNDDGDGPSAEPQEILSGARRLPRTDPAAALKSSTCWRSLDSGVAPVHSTVAEKLSAEFPGCDLLGWVPRWAVLALGLANTTVWVYRDRGRRAKIWDHAGAMLLFEEAGGEITDVHGKPIDLSQGRLLKANFGFVASPGGESHARVLKAVHETLREQGKEELLV
ncbi:hypothetical protein QBC42DRAFT_338389 [Cladorrhinum samala]|uniref:3'(2'),5'-bisphosphate nucleotidase n=1 Tax=Cladorrhinum samala TaxID=585594 RepID=A0AAV9HNI2_9PEZI|nr:hypothetical protein QBC42DRAFT_338389 [Cladorrhinum samala]